MNHISLILYTLAMCCCLAPTMGHAQVVYRRPRWKPRVTAALPRALAIALSSRNDNSTEFTEDALTMIPAYRLPAGIDNGRLMREGAVERDLIRAAHWGGEFRFGKAFPVHLDAAKDGVW